MCQNSTELFEECREPGKTIVLSEETQNAQIKVTVSWILFK